MPLVEQKASTIVPEASPLSAESVELATKIPDDRVENDEIPSYGQSPDASDLGVPVDHIPVQESIVKSLIEEQNSDEKSDLSDLTNLHQSADRNSGNQVLPEKVNVKLYATFTTTNELPSNCSKDRLNETVALRVGNEPSPTTH